MRTRGSLATFVLIVTLAASPGPAHAQNEDPYKVDFALDGTITGVAIAGAVLLSQLRVDRAAEVREQELFAIDQSVRSRYSYSAAKLADATLLVTITTPLATQISRPLDRNAGERALLYGEVLAVNLLLNAGIKYLVQRPRPFRHSPHPQIVDQARDDDDAFLSFYSGHASTAFAAAVGGSYLFALDQPDKTARAILWGVELGFAAMTADLRVRAGRHYYSDVIVGALAGSGLGLLLPLAHGSHKADYKPSGREWAAMGIGLVSGVAIAELWPVAEDYVVPLITDDPVESRLSPLVLPGGAGLSVTHPW